MSSTSTPRLSASLTAYLTECETKGTLKTKDGDYAPPRKLYDGFFKTKHPIYKTWQRMLASHYMPSKSVDNVSAEFKDFDQFFEWYKSQVTHIEKPLELEFKITRINAKQLYSRHNSQLVNVNDILHPLDIRNHLTMGKLQDFEDLIKLKHPIRIFAEYFGWSISKASRILKYYKETQRARLEEEQNQPKPQNLSSMMVADSKKRKVKPE